MSLFLGPQYVLAQPQFLLDFFLAMAKKQKKPLVTEESSQNDKLKKSKNLSPSPDAKAFPKPQRGLAIGDNFGWTGKLPATLLFEHCQKQKWNKVIISMRKSSKGFIGVVDLLWENTKTRETIHLKWQPDTDLLPPRESTNEARHFAATYAMYRLNYFKNLKMVLPSLFRNYWSDMEARRLEVLKKDKVYHDKIYNANPFQVHLDGEAAQELKEREKKAKDNSNAKIKKPMTNILLSDAKIKPKPSSKSITRDSVLLNSFPIGKKAWENAPFVDFPSEIRASIENSIKRHINWIESTRKKSVEKNDMQNWLSRLSQIGFRPSHAQEALNYTSTFIDALEWLLFHVPEDDLPQYFAKREEDRSLSFKISKNIKIEYVVQRLSDSGYDKDEILAVLKENNYDEHLTAIALTHKITGCEVTSMTGPGDNRFDLWIDELEGIEMIGSNKVEFSLGSKKVVSLLLNISGISTDLLLVKLYFPNNYPHQFPGVQIIVNDSSYRLANYIKLSIIRHLYAFVSGSNLLGDCYLYTLVEWLEGNASSVIKNPGPLLISPQTKKFDSHQKKDSPIINRRRGRTDKLLSADIEAIQRSYRAIQGSKELKRSVEKRKELPAWLKKDELVNIICSSKVTLVTGETGSGKSTQIVQFVLDKLSAGGNFKSKIICTQPRRISTIGLAERISDERCLTVGEETGYIIRGENKTLKTTRLLFVTTGVLLKMLQSHLSLNDGVSSMFDDLEFIFIDEVHERSVDSDFLLNILKKIIGKLPKLKVILMSATINLDIFIKYLPTDLKKIHIEGRTFPIEDVYLDKILSETDYSMSTNDDEFIKPKADSNFFKTGRINNDLIAKLCVYVDSKLQLESNLGSILVFLPGIMEISQCIRNIEDEFRRCKKKVWCLPLHSALSAKDQKRVFLPLPSDVRRIVVSTNIGETSITISDCVTVIDSGRSKNVFFDPLSNTTRLVENWCSRAEMAQRRGRSGRIQKGTCYHLYTKETENSVLSQPIPEIRRTRLENLYLLIKAMGINNVAEFLREGLDSPEEHYLDKAQSLLSEIGALDSEGNLTHLGKYLSLIPTDLQAGKIMLLGCIFGCVDICLTLAAICSSGCPFSNNFEIKDQVKRAKSILSKGHGDLIASAFAYHQWAALSGTESKKFIINNNLSYLKLQEIRSNRAQYLLTLKEIGFIPFSYEFDPGNKFDENNENMTILKAIITGSFTPQVARVQLPDTKYAQTLVGAVEIDSDARQTKFWIRNDKYINQIYSEKPVDEKPALRVFIHPSSLFLSSSESSTTNVSLEKLTLGDGSIDVQKAKEQIELTPPAKINSNTMNRAPFAVYLSANHTSKLYIRDITPTSTLSVLLFGGKISYDIAGCISTGNKCPGIVLDLWMPIRTWCKNGVLIKRLRILLDEVIENKLADCNNKLSEDDEEVLHIIIDILLSEKRLC